MRAATRVLALPDLHAPYHDKHALSIVKQFKKDFKPHITIALGDWVDGTPVSSFAKDVQFYDQLDEFDICNAVMDELQPDVYFEGNHEERFRRQGNLPQDIRRLLDPRLWLHLDKRGVQWVPYSAFTRDLYTLGNLTFVHGFACNQYAAAKEASRFGNVVHGHTHRIQRITIPQNKGKATGYNIGCLCDLHQEYAAVRHPNGWSHGFGYGYIYRSGNFSFNIAHIEDEYVHLEGKRYRVTKDD